MTEQEFDEHRFSVNTEVEYMGNWEKVTEVDLEDRWFGVESGYYLKFDDEGVGSIRNSTDKGKE
jgi:hypothetical protein